MDDKMDIAPADGVFIVRPGPRIEALVPEDSGAAEGSQEALDFEDVVTSMAFLMYAMERMDWREEFLGIIQDPDTFHEVFGTTDPPEDTGPKLTLIHGGGDDPGADKNKES